MKNWICPTFLLLSIVFASAPVVAQKPYRSASDFGKRRALLIGNSKYGGEHGDVESAHDDVVRLSEVLRSQYDFDVTVLENLPAAQILEAMRGLESADSSAAPYAVLVYFSGHGEKGIGSSRGAWLGVDAGAESDPKGRVPRHEIVKILNKVPALHALVIDDSCYSGAVPEPSEQADPLDSELASHVRLPSLRSRFESDPGKNETLRSRYWLSASGDESAFPGRSGRETSLFTRYLLQALQQNDAMIETAELFLAIRRRMSTNPLPQVPIYFPLPGNGGGDFMWVHRQWSSDEFATQVGRFVITTATTDSEQSPTIAKLGLVRLVRSALERVERDHPAVAVRRFSVEILLPREGLASLVLSDRDDEHLIDRQALLLGDDLQSNVKHAVNALSQSIDLEAENQKISVDIVSRALRAQRRHRGELIALAQLTVFASLRGETWINQPAGAIRAGGGGYVHDWLVLGCLVGYEYTWSKTDRRAFLGDLSDGSYADVRLRGELQLQTWSAMATATLRRSHGIALPLGYLGVGFARHRLDLGDEHFVPQSRQDTLPISTVNRRRDVTGLAALVEVGVGVQYLLSAKWAVVGRGHVFMTAPALQVRSRVDGFAQARSLVSDFQSLGGFALQLGVSRML